MREQDLRPAQKRRFRPKTTDSRHPHKIAENWLAKVPAPELPGMVWQSDFTCIETGEGWLYLAFTLDACTRRPSTGSGPCRSTGSGPQRELVETAAWPTTAAKPAPSPCHNP